MYITSCPLGFVDIASDSNFAAEIGVIDKDKTVAVLRIVLKMVVEGLVEVDKAVVVDMIAADDNIYGRICIYKTATRLEDPLGLGSNPRIYPYTNNIRQYSKRRYVQ